MRHQDPIVITSYARTPLGAFQGKLSSLSAPQLGQAAIQATVERSGISKDSISNVNLGCVLAAGLGQAPARQAALLAGLAEHTDCTTINKMCGSGLKAIMLSYDNLLADSCTISIAGGIESMSNTPYLLPKARAGLRMGHTQCLDHMFFDGLEDAYDKGKLMGVFAEQTASHYGFTREEQDQFAVNSLDKAKMAMDKGYFDQEITPVNVAHRKQTETVLKDEIPLKAQPDKIPKLKPAFKENGTVTAANASSIADGAACVMLMRQSHAQQNQVNPLAIIHGHSTHSQAPAWFTTAPVKATQALLSKLNWSIDDVDLFEINEAFAVVTLAAIKELQLPPEKVNIHGGACALGHPIGASGARIICTLLSALQHHDLQRGIASLCIGGGEAVAIAIERVI